MTHGLMFHYFHNDEIAKTQGSISAEQFERIIDRYSAEHNIISAEEYLKKAEEKALSAEDVCITFDDGLYSQFAIADKILQKKGLTAFYFVYTSPMTGILEKMEVYRTFRNQYDSIKDFYDDFFSAVVKHGDDNGINYKEIMSSEKAKSYFQEYEYYSSEDRLFRYLRNEVLNEKYDFIMKSLMEQRNFDPQEECKKIWITQEQLEEMDMRGDVIGLHSHTHFTSLNGMTFEQKESEYRINKAYLEKIVRDGVETASYPCDTFDLETDSILTSLGIKVAFIAHYEETDKLNLHRIPRVDASAILNLI